MAEPDYDNYTLNDLNEAWESINKAAYPERAARIKAILDDPEAFGHPSDEEVDPVPESPNPSIKRGWFYGGMVLWMLGLYVLATGNLPLLAVVIDEVWQRAVIFALMFAGGFQVYKRAFETEDQSDDLSRLDW